MTEALELNCVVDAQDALKYLESASVRVDRAIEAGLDDVADAIFDVSQQKVPFLTGRLQASGNVRQGPMLRVVGYHTPYARVVHQGYAGFSKWNPKTKKPSIYKPRKAKPWLADSVAAVKPRIGMLLRMAFNRAMTEGT